MSNKARWLEQKTEGDEGESAFEAMLDRSSIVYIKTGVETTAYHGNIKGINQSGSRALRFMPDYYLPASNTFYEVKGYPVNRTNIGVDTYQFVHLLLWQELYKTYFAAVNLGTDVVTSFPIAEVKHISHGYFYNREDKDTLMMLQDKGYTIGSIRDGRNSEANLCGSSSIYIPVPVK